MAGIVETYRTILNLHNPHVNANSCPGHCTTHTRRCTSPIATHKQLQVDDLLQQICDAPADDHLGLPQLIGSLTRTILCHDHLVQDRMRIGTALLRAFLEQKWLEEDGEEGLAELVDVVLPRPVLPRPPVGTIHGVYVGGSVCGICLEETMDTVLTPCGHYFCLGCVAEFFNRWTKFCPMDRTELSWDELVMA